MNFIGDATAIPQLARTLTPGFEQATPEMVEKLLTTILARHTVLVTVEAIDRALWELNHSATLDEAKEKLHSYLSEYSTVALALKSVDSAALGGVATIAEGAAATTPTPPSATPEAPTFTHSPRAHNPFGYL